MYKKIKIGEHLESALGSLSRTPLGAASNDSLFDNTVSHVSTSFFSSHLSINLSSFSNLQYHKKIYIVQSPQYYRLYYFVYNLWTLYISIHYSNVTSSIILLLILFYIDFIFPLQYSNYSSYFKMHSIKKIQIFFNIINYYTIIKTF